MKSLFVKNTELDEAGKEIVILGTDSDAVLTFTILMQNNVYVKCFCDGSEKKDSTLLMNKPIVLLSELESKKDQIILVVGGPSYIGKAEMLEKEGYEVFLDYNFAAYSGNCVLFEENRN